MWLRELRSDLDLTLNTLFPFVLLATGALYLKPILLQQPSPLSLSLNRFLVLDNNVLVSQIALAFEELLQAVVWAFSLAFSQMLGKRFPKEKKIVYFALEQIFHKTAVYLWEKKLL